MKVSRRVLIKNKSGLHTRPATVIAKLLRSCKSRVFFTCRKERVNAKSILAILMLAAEKNSRIIITCEGIDALSTINKLVRIFESRFRDEEKIR